MPLLQPRVTFRPMEYPWAFEAWETQQKIHWLALEVPMADDVNDWHNKVTPAEKNLITQIFRFFTQADVEVSNCYQTQYAAVFKPTEIRMMLAAFCNQETIHIQAYAHLLDTLGLPEVEYEAFLKYKEMKDKYDYMQGFSVKNKFEIARTLCAFGALTEGMQLFASFAILLNFPRRGLFKGMGQMVTWSVRDETLHCQSLAKLFRQFVREHPKVFKASMHNEIQEIARTMVGHEDAFVDLAYSMGDVEGLKAEEVKTYIRYLTDRRLVEYGLKPIYNIEKNPLPWLDEMLGAVEFVNFFEQRSTEYSKAATAGEWSDAFN